MTDAAETYSHGHHESVLRSHEWRTAENSAAYLLPVLARGQDLLDVGCGPGTITLDLAARVAPGRVLGIDRSDDVVAQARDRIAGSGLTNVEFATGDVYALDLADASFDVAHAHQVLQHLVDPVAALRELHRVLRQDGVLAVRDSDYAAFAWAPASPGIERWNALYHAITTHNRAEADAGRYLLGWVRAAGFRDAVASSATWTFADPERRAWWGSLWADRVEHSAFADQAVEYGLSDADELAEIAAAWRAWADEPDGFFAVLHGEVLARR
jgi:ubiquinone/menaquinone biosynthesis C-methylase UbiE